MSPGIRPASCGVALFLTAISAVAAESVATRPVTPDQPETQRRLQAETQQVARRLGTMLRFLTYHRLESGEEKKLLADAAATLGGLSKNEMEAVIAHLDASVKAPDDASAGDEARKAYERHRDVVKNLKSLLLKYDTIRTLDQAAERLERAARSQHDMRMSALTLAQQLRSGKMPRGRGAVDTAVELSDQQGDLHRDLEALFGQLDKLPPFLSPDHKARLAASKASEKGKMIVEVETLAARHLKQNEPHAAAPHQQKAADGLLELAHALRSIRDPLETLKEARALVDKTQKEQEQLTKETEMPPMKNQRTSTVDQATRHARDMAAKQARLEFDAKDARDLLKEVAKDVSETVKKAITEMEKAEEELNNATKNTQWAKKPQEKAAEELKAARDKLDEMIARAEKKKTDPLEAVKAAIEKVDELIKDETKNREKTEATKGTDTDKMPAISKEQKEIAKKTDEVKAAPLADKPEVKDALKKAGEAMDKAAKALDDKKGLVAVKKQDDAIKDLQAAKKALEDQAKDIEKRRDDIAKLEDAEKKLGELAKKQDAIADKAADMDKAGKKDDAKDLAKEQGDLKPETKEVGAQLKDAVPEAAKKVEMAGEKMDVAKKDLDDKKLDPAAKEGKKAAEDLKDAQKEVAKALADKKGQEANDQAKLEPMKVAPMNAADQIAKAIEQAEAAQADAKKAQEQLGDKPMDGDKPMKNPAADLQKLQEKVAEKAGELKKDDAKKAAQEAAEALKMGDIPAAVEAQEKAIEALQAGEKKEPMPGDKGDKPMPGDKGDKPMPGDKGDKPMPGDKGMGQPDPAGAKDPGELAKVQKQIKDATEALKQAQETNAAAQAALQQAQAQAPMAVMPELDKAAQQLAQAQQALEKATPEAAQQAQAQAQKALEKALQTLQAAEAQKPDMGMGMEPGMGMGMKPDMGMPGMDKGKPDGMGKKPGMGMGMGMNKGPSQEQNATKGKGDRDADGRLKNAESKLKDVRGDGAFINLPARQREMIQQALSGTLPPEYGATIRQYFMNVAGGKPAATPMTGKK